MKKTLIGLIAVLLLGSMLLVACEGEETSTTSEPAGTATTAATGTTGAATDTTVPSTEVTTSAALAQVIEAAKAEGEVNYFCGAHVYDSDVLAQGIKDTFGVDIKVNLIPGDQRKTLATLQMEMEAGAAPSFDLMTAAGTNIANTLKPANMMADVEWASLITADTDPEIIIPAPANYPATWGYVMVVAYDSTKVSPDQLPKNFQECTDPKYSGKFGWVSYASANAEMLYFLNKTDETGLQFMRDLTKNKPVLGSYSDLSDKLTLGELDFALIGSHEFSRIASQDPKYKCVTLSDFCEITENSDVVLRGAKNANAATLLVLYLCTPEGQKYNRSTFFGSYLDPDSIEHAMVAEATAKGIPVVQPERDADYLTWEQSPEYKAFEKEVNAIIKGQ